MFTGCVADGGHARDLSSFMITSEVDVILRKSSEIRGWVEKEGINRVGVGVHTVEATKRVEVWNLCPAAVPSGLGILNDRTKNRAIDRATETNYLMERSTQNRQAPRQENRPTTRCRPAPARVAVFVSPVFYRCTHSHPQNGVSLGTFAPGWAVSTVATTL